MASSEQSPETRELSLVGKVEFRIALADSDEKLETVLKTYLPPVLLKLASPHVSVRSKVISICQHVNTRIRSPTIKLPVVALVEQFKAHPNTPLIRHFDLLYIQQGVRRMTASESDALFPVVIRGISADSQGSAQHGSQLLNLVFQLLEHFHLPARGTEEDAGFRTKLQLIDEDATYLASWIGKLILFVPIKIKPGTSIPDGTSCPGLTADEYSFLTVQNRVEVWDPSASQGLNLATIKARAAKLLSSGLFKDEERFFPALFASADPASAVSGSGDDILKRATPNTDLEDEIIVRQLFSYFFGEDTARGRVKARAPLRMKIFGLLSKSIKSTSFSSQIVKMANEGISDPNAATGPDAMQIDGPPQQAGGGREAMKLRGALFSYINFVARYGPQESLYAIAPRVLGRLRDFIESQGWPRPAGYEDLASRGYAYEVIGLLAKAGPKDLVVEPSLDTLRWLFESLAQEVSSNSITVSIEESLSTVLGAFTKHSLDSETSAALESLLIHQMTTSAKAEQDPESRRRSTRYVAVRFANRCLPYMSVGARWVDMLAIAAGPRDRQEVSEEGRRGLSPYWYRMLNGSLQDDEDIVFPEFTEVVRYLFREAPFDGRTVSDDLPASKLVGFLREAQPNAFPDTIGYCRAVLLYEALKDSPTKIKFDSDWENKLNVVVESDEQIRSTVRHHLDKIWQSEGSQAATLEILLVAFYTCLTSPTSTNQAALEAQKHFIDLCSMCPDSLQARIAPDYTLLQPGINSNQHTLRQSSAHAFGLLASHPVVSKDSAAAVNATISELIGKASGWKTAVGAAVNQVHGATTALAYYFSRSEVRHSTETTSEAQSELLTITTNMLLESNDPHLKEAAFKSIGELCLFQVLKPSAFGEADVLRKIIDRIADIAKGGNEPAALALGHIAMILDEPNDNSATAENNLLLHIQERIHKMHEIKQAETHFAVGEALSCLAIGWSSKALATRLDISASTPTGPSRTKALSGLLDRTLKDCANTKPSLRKASVIWLLCLVQFCGHESDVQSRLPNCQVAFKRCLTDRDDLVQETASRGLGLVYEKGDRKLRDDLVRDLVGSFSDSKRSGQSGLAGTVSDETQLFEPGALPTGQGESVSTYKDIMNLASEVGDSSLVYRFMSMASSNAIWSSRAALGRFGLSSVLSDASVDGYLAKNPKLYPSLYRYRFDPNEGVRRSMNDIWNALVKDSNKTVEEYFDPIMDELLSNILGREWRTRQASCAAIADLVSGRQIEKYEKYLEQIWNVCFRVLDDVKESVRTAAASLARTLTGILTRTLEADTSASKNAALMLKNVLPFLLSTSGLESSAQEVQMFALHTLLEIIKKGSAVTLRPFIPELVEKLLGLLSSLEPQAVNYVYLNADKYNLTERKIDDMRLSSIRSSPLMEAIERCLDLLDDATMAELQPRIESAMKSAVGLPSKVGCSRVLVSLSTRRNMLFKPHADHFLRLVEKAILDRNDTVASSYAMAAGYVARSASDKQILRLSSFARKLYFESEGDRDAALPRRAVAAGEILHAVSKHASDRFNALAADMIPFVFVAKHDGHDTVRELFQDMWNDNVGGPRAISLYLREIIDMAVAHLESPVWAIKHTAAKSIADATVAMASLGMDEKSAGMLWPVIEKALAGKTWEGKEVVLEAFVKFVESGKVFWQKNANVAQAIEKVRVFSCCVYMVCMMSLAAGELDRRGVCCETSTM